MTKPEPIKRNANAIAVARDYDPEVFSPSEIAINRGLDVIEAWLDAYIVTPLLGKDGAASTSPQSVWLTIPSPPLARGRV